MPNGTVHSGCSYPTQATTHLVIVLVYSYFEKGCRKNVHATTPKGNMGYDQYTVPNDCSCRTYFCCFPLALANICPWPLVPFFQISLENRADKTTHNTFRDCRVHFFRQPFSKQLYIIVSPWPYKQDEKERYWGQQFCQMERDISRLRAVSLFFCSPSSKTRDTQTATRVTDGALVSRVSRLRRSRTRTLLSLNLKN